jgi:hypothetical protein
MDLSTFGRGRMRNSIYVSTIVIAIAGLFFTVLTTPAASEDQSRACALAVLPPEMQRQIQANYSSWQVQDVPNLSASAKGRWQSEKPLGCLGIAVGLFQSVNQKSYAVLLVPVNKPETGYRLLVFTSRESGSPEPIRIIEQSDMGGASNFFVHQITISKFFSTAWVKKLRVSTKDGILFADAGKSEYETDIYFWTGEKYSHEAVDY